MLGYGGCAEVDEVASEETCHGPHSALLELGGELISVEDDGPGISDSEFERVFEPFYRVEASRSRDTGGTGLGLAVVRSIVRGHGGDVVLANRAEGGLRATVILPVASCLDPGE